MSRKDEDGFGDLLRYINRPERRSGWAVLQNFGSGVDGVTALEAELLENAALGRRRKNGVWFYHEVLSWGAGEAASLTESMMEAVARHYLERRAPRALGYAKAHFDSGHPHVHCLISAHELGTGKKVRLSRADFAEVKREVKRYQVELCPALEERGQGKEKGEKRLRRRRAEGELRRRKGEGESGRSQKELVRGRLLEIFGTGVVQDAARLEARLGESGFRLYQRGKTLGVEALESSRRYRLKTLGVLEAYEGMLKRWERQKVASKGFWSLRWRKWRRKYRCWEVGKLVERVLEGEEGVKIGGIWERQLRRKRGRGKGRGR